MASFCPPRPPPLPPLPEVVVPELVLPPLLQAAANPRVLMALRIRRFMTLSS